MSLFQIFNAFEKYSMDTLFIALIVVIITSFVKRIVFKNKFKKIITFIPFILGIFLYALYLYVLEKTPLENLISKECVKKGITSGGLGTVYYVFYEQFIRGKRNLEQFNIFEITAEGVLSAIVVKDFVGIVSKDICDKILSRLDDKNYCIDVVCDSVKGKLIEGTSQLEVLSYSKLLITSLLSLK